MRLTTTDQRLGRAEVGTTLLAVVASTGLYLRYRHPYLARGVVGDIAGLAVCSLSLGTTRRRLRHEAMVCFAGIGAVYATTMRWPLRFPEPFWWAAIAIALAAYASLRRLALLSSQESSEP